jgi:hypothetical protein
MANWILEFYVQYIRLHSRPPKCRKWVYNILQPHLICSIYPPDQPNSYCNNYIKPRPSIVISPKLTLVFVLTIEKYI